MTPYFVSVPRGTKQFSIFWANTGTTFATGSTLVPGTESQQEVLGVPDSIVATGGLTTYEAIGSIVLMCFGVGLAVLFLTSG